MDASARGQIEEGDRERVTRRMRTLEEKLAIINETAAPGASVAAVARKYGMNANLLFGWRRLQQSGLLESKRHAKAPALLPVKLTPRHSRPLNALVTRRPCRALGCRSE